MSMKFRLVVLLIVVVVGGMAIWSHQTETPHRTDLAMELTRKSRLLHGAKLARQRLQVKQQLAEALVMQEMTLLQASRALLEYLELENAPQGVMCGKEILAREPGDSAEERAAKNLLRWVTDVENVSLSQREARRHELENELLGWLKGKPKEREKPRPGENQESRERMASRSGRSS